MNRQEQIDVIRAFPTRLEAIVGELRRAQISAIPIDNEWSIAQNVHHCADSHMNSYVRCKLMATEDNPTLKPYDEVAWAQFADSNTTDLSNTFALLRGLHARWADFWESLGDDDWARTGYHPGNDATVTLADQLEGYVRHCNAHIDQIQRNLKAMEY